MSYKRLNLNGTWQIAPGNRIPENWKYQVPVPALVDVAIPRFDWQKSDYFFYRKEFTFHRTDDSRTIFLELEQVKYGTEIWLNGEFVGGDIPCYTRQEFDVTAFVKPGQNVLVVRVGQKSTLPPESAVGNDFEKLSFIPGIWGDVWIHVYGSGRVAWCRILPDLNTGKISVHVEIENLREKTHSFRAEFRVQEKGTGKPASETVQQQLEISGNSISSLDFQMALPDFQPWSPESPFLYQFVLTLSDEQGVSHIREILFGMREFRIRGGRFYLNGKRRVLLGSNIAFHRMLSDPKRGTLPWHKSWIRRALAEIPREHNLFFFRMHLGHAYNRWYDIADEAGILLQDEWMFWNTTGSPAQIEKELTAWVKENINHPGIVIWDSLNESQDDFVLNQLIPKLKKIDPGRPWEQVDFPEEHPYIYSLGPVLTNKKFGYSRAVIDLRKSKQPVMVNEYLWWWLDEKGKPTWLTKPVVPRWLGPNPNDEQLIAHQNFLASELGELWRRLDLDAILPFVYLSSSGGATANWFWGPLKVLRPKPLLEALKIAFSPVGVSIELWDRHFLCGEKRLLSLYLFNDTAEEATVILNVFFRRKPEETLHQEIFHLSGGEHRKVKRKLQFPSVEGADELVAAIYREPGEEIAHSSKPVFIFYPPGKIKPAHFPQITVHDTSGEVISFLQRSLIPFYRFPAQIEKSRVLLIYGAFPGKIFAAHSDEIREAVRKGAVLILQEPEVRVRREHKLEIFPDLTLTIRYRRDPEKGGYDSVVHPHSPGHFLWNGILPEHLHFFNGGFGGEMVSQHSLFPGRPFNAAAACNLDLRLPAVLEIPYGKGWVIISRIQVRGRLNTNRTGGRLYDRRYDAVAEKYFRNLLTGYPEQENYRQQTANRLQPIRFFISDVTSSTGQVFDIEGRSIFARWEVETVKREWFWVQFGNLTSLAGVRVKWNKAFSGNLEIHVSWDNRKWEKLFEGRETGHEIFVKPSTVECRYVKIFYQKGGIGSGFAISEVTFLSPESS